MRVAWSEMLRLRGAIAGALAARWASYAAMSALALAGERRPGPTLPDLVLERLPYLAWVDRANYLAWLALYLPLNVVLLLAEPARWVRYMVTGAIVALARGVCVVLTTLGPPDAGRPRADLASASFAEAWWELVSPLGVFGRDSIAVFLSQDLFFSGHAATTFLLVLYLWHRQALRWVALAAHAAVVASVLVAHLHYSIDVVGAWAVTFAVYALREWGPRARAGAASGTASGP